MANVGSSLPVPKWLKLRVTTWARRMGLAQTWHITVIMRERLKVDGKACKAVTEWAEGYQTATISFDLTTYNDFDERTLDVLICHELAHLIHAREDDTLSEMVGRKAVYRAYAKEAERAADMYAVSFVRAYARKKE